MILAEQRRKARERKKPCDHASIINQLEVMVKSKENEYANSRDELMKHLKQREKELNNTIAAIKNRRA